MSRIHVVSLALLGLVSGLCFDAQALTLEEAERQALMANKDVLLGGAAVAASEAGIVAAGQRPNPNLTLQTVNIDPRRGVGGGTLNRKSVDSTVGVSWLWERGGKLELRLAAARAQREAAQYGLADSRRVLTQAVRSGYYDLKEAQERVALLGESQALLEESLRTADRRVNAGDLPPLDRTRVEVEVMRGDNERRAAEGDVAEARQVLGVLLGGMPAPAVQAITASDPWPGTPGAAPANITPGTSSSTPVRPDVQQAARLEEAAVQSRELARSLGTRDITVGAQVERFPPDMRASAGFTVSIPLFTSHRFGGELARAEADLTTARLTREKLELQAEADRQGARQQLTLAQGRLDMLGNAGLRAARDAAEGTELAYRQGAASLTDVLDARRQLRAVQIELVQSYLDQAKALAAWRAATEWDRP